MLWGRPRSRIHGSGAKGAPPPRVGGQSGISGMTGTAGCAAGPRAPGACGRAASGAPFDDVAVRGGRQPQADAGQAVERDPPVAAPVPAEDGPVRVPLDVPAPQAVMDAHGPAPGVGEHPVHPRQDPVRRAVSDRLFVPGVPRQAAVPGPAVGDDPRAPGATASPMKPCSAPEAWFSTAFSRMRRGLPHSGSSTAPVRRILPDTPFAPAASAPPPSRQGTDVPSTSAVPCGRPRSGPAVFPARCHEREHRGNGSPAPSRHKMWGRLCQRDKPSQRNPD